MLALLKSDARRIPLADESVQCVVTSPPYWGLRKYAGEQELVWGGREDCEHEWAEESVVVGRMDGGRDIGGRGGNYKGNGPHRSVAQRGICQLCGAWRGAYGLEPTVELYVQHTVEILREIRRVLRTDGVLFWNIGDSYAGGKGQSGQPMSAALQLERAKSGESINRGQHQMEMATRPSDSLAGLRSCNLKPKDLCLIPFRVALAAQSDGWWIRSDIIWAKPNPMPESVTDRPTDSYEHVLMLTKRAKYYWDAEAVREDGPSYTRKAGGYYGRDGENASRFAGKGGFGDSDVTTHGRNLRNVWTFTTQAFPDSHFATFPEELPKRCILAATKLGDLVLDPFAGSGTVGKVAIELGRRAILCDLAYQDLASKRTAAIQRPLLEASL